MRRFHAVIGAGADGVVCREHDVPEAGPGQLLVRAHACSLNWREILVVRNARERHDDPGSPDLRTGGVPPARVVAATGTGADHTVEVAGTLRESLAATTVGGELALVGAVESTAAETPLDSATLRSRMAVIRPLAVGSHAQFAALARMIAITGLTPLIDRVFAFEESVDALRYLERQRPIGKVVIAIAA